MMPEVFTPFKSDVDMILDGELIALNGGVYDFLKERSKGKNLKFVAFDCLYYSKDVRNLPLLERKKFIPNNPIEFEFANSKDEILKLFNKAVKDYEGVVVKANVAYGKNHSWIKIKKINTIDCIVTKIAETKDYIENGFPRSFHIAVKDGDKLVEIGRASSLKKGINPFDIKVGSIIEVDYQEVLRRNGISLRHPRVIKIRRDKSEDECLIDIKSTVE
jgi:ATP-dependent DNA ligase